MRKQIGWFFISLLGYLALAGTLGAQAGLPEPLREVRIDQQLNAQVPLDLVFKDEEGRAVPLSAYFGRKPVVLGLVYYQCPMLCTMILNGTLRAVRALSLEAGEDFEIVSVSFDPREGPELAAPKKAEYVRRYGREGGRRGWHFLTGEEDAIRKLTDTVGFYYKYDPATGQYAHASAIIVLTPEGRVARYLYGIEYAPRDLRLALVEASAGRIGTPVDQALLYCFHYDPETGKYGLLIMNIIRILGSATVISLAAFILIMFRRDRKKRVHSSDGLPAIS